MRIRGERRQQAGGTKERERELERGREKERVGRKGRGKGDGWLGFGVWSDGDQQ